MHTTLLILFGVLVLFFGLLYLLLYAPVRSKVSTYLDTKTEWASGELDSMFLEVQHRRLMLAYILTPLLLGGLAYFITRQWLMVGAGFVVGLLIPQMWIMRMKAVRLKKFNAQLVDSLMLLSSSMKAGLSIIQSIEVLVEEMPAPISQEFGLMLKENRMGVSLQDSFERLKKRMVSPDLGLIVTAIMVARETGGDVTSVFGRLIETIRTRRQLYEKVNSLTFMSRAQGFIMMGIPIFFAFMVTRMRPDYFDVMKEEPMGRVFIALAVVLWLIGAGLLMILSRVKL